MAFIETPEADRDHGLLVGFIAGLTERYPETENDLKQFICETPGLAPIFPQLCLRLRVIAADVPMAIAGFQSGLISPKNLGYWNLGGQLAQLPGEAVSRYWTHCWSTTRSHIHWH